MVIGVARIELALAECASLKDKRRIVRRVIERTRGRFDVAVAEIEDQDLWQRAVIGVSCVSSSVGHASEVLQKVVAFVVDAHPECEVVDDAVELLTLF